MTFGKRVKKVRKNVSEDSGTVDKVSEKVSGKDNSIYSSSDNNNSSSNIIDSSVKQKRASSFLKRKGKSKKSDVLLFGMAKEEKLELFVKNIKIIHPKIPDFWLEKEIQKFKKKFNIE